MMLLWTSQITRHFLRSYALKNSRAFYTISNTLIVKKRKLITLPFDNVNIIDSCMRNYAKKAGKAQKGGKPKTILLSDEELSGVINAESYRQELLHIKEKLKKDYIEHLSLRSAANAIDSINVKLDGEAYPLHELAQISKKNPNLIAINMVDFPDALKPAIQAILESGSGLNPQQDGTMIYIQVPKLTREHRENLAKNARTIFIRSKDDIRNVQNHYVKEAKKREDLSEDLIFSATNQIMSIAEQTTNELENIMKNKQKELVTEK